MKRLGLFLSVLFAAAVASGSPSLYVGTVAGEPGATVQVPVYYTSDTNAVSLQFDLVYATNVLTAGGPVGGSALADHLIGTSEFTSGIRRVLIFSFSNTPFTNGVLAYVPFAIAPDATDHDEALALNEVLVVSAAADPIPLGPVLGGRVAISPSPQLGPVTTTPGGFHIQLGGSPGRTYVIEGADAPDSQQWSALATNTAAGGIATFDDPSAPGPARRFYRARLEP